MFFRGGGAKDIDVNRSPERGSALIVTMILMAALLAGAVALTSLQLHSTRNAGLARDRISALHCAEAGLVVAKATVAANYSLWNAALEAGTEPSWLASLDHDIDGDGVPDFTITLRDNDDEVPADPTRDNDLTVYVVSRCTKYADVSTEVVELVRYNGGGSCYDAQLGGCGGNNNAN
jgi:Tfp pilus assembly protein PilX